MIAPPPRLKNKTKQKNSNFVDNSAHIYFAQKIQHQVNTFRDIGLLSEFSVGLVNQFQLLWC